MTKTPCRVGPWQVIRTENTIHTRKAGRSFPPDRRRNRGSYVRFVSGAPNRFDLEGQPVRTGLPLAIEPTADRPERQSRSPIVKFTERSYTHTRRLLPGSCRL